MSILFYSHKLLQNCAISRNQYFKNSALLNFDQNPKVYFSNSLGIM